MKKGFLSQYFDGVAVKCLSQVEADICCSHQHEFNGVDGLKAILGEPSGKVQYPVRCIYISDNEESLTASDAYFTWYDARQKARRERKVMRWEYRLYFTSNDALSAAQVNDLLVIAKNKDESLLAVVAAGGSAAARQLRWMFGFTENLEAGLNIRSEEHMDTERIGIAERFILEQIGIEIEDDAQGDLDLILNTFGNTFPPTAAFSTFVRDLMPHVSCRDDQDAALLAWMEKEEVLYRTLERHLLIGDLGALMQAYDGAALDPEPFIKTVQSTLQRRKSRAGAALENHLEAIFREHHVRYTRAGITENRLKPDFIFPTIESYHDRAFPEGRLTMLGVKTTCKDRWRQILNEAARISNKHLLTIEPGISEYQTDEMETQRVSLVVPKGIQSSFTPRQQGWLMSLADFIRYVSVKAE